MARPVRELKAFAKVDLDPGETTVVEFTLAARDLSYWSTSLNDWVLEGGEFELAVGASSRDLRLTTTVDIAAPPLPVRLDGMSTLQEWLADPTGSALLHKAVGTDEDGRPKGILGNEELIAGHRQLPDQQPRRLPRPRFHPRSSSTAWSTRSPRETDSDLGATGESACRSSPRTMNAPPKGRSAPPGRGRTPPRWSRVGAS